MSLFGGGSECSTGSNPLAQFNKHSQQDRTLQHAQPGSSAQHQQMNIRSEMAMNAQDQGHMNRFFNAGPQHPAAAPQDSFNFQGMRTQLPHVMSQQQHSQSNWSQEFHQPAPQQMHSPTANAWSGEFQQQRANTVSPLSANSGSLMSSSGLGSSASMMMRSRMGYNPMLNQMRQSQSQQQGVQSMNADAQMTSATMDASEWEDKFKELDQQMNQTEQTKTEEKDEIIIDDKHKADFEEIWESMKNQDMENTYSNQWEKDFETYAQNRRNYGQYSFEKTNQFLHNPDAYEIGLILMENGAKLSEAALAFEAAIQENPNHIEAWLKLGEVQTSNEKEIAGLTALEKCLTLDPTNLSALMTLAISYINEGYDNAAFATLERWIETKYPQITSRARQTNPVISDEDRFTLHKRVIELYLQAAQLSPSGANIDADVQMGLGVLFYANEEFDKTIDCFKAALSVRPDDELLWNRLGASLANSNRSEEAIQAYLEALRLKPSFVRARYNLGVSSINIGCYKEAAEHLLGALSMHDVEGNGTATNLAYVNQSTSILETLKRAFLAMNRRDLLEKVKPTMNLDQFRGEFNF
ncbi:hypothetical protein WICPIJ_005653 [Wickerhamomyces pijperi]|uniref:Peroxisomal targeting signal receptor n=1 Tax=Wickerhamomyces pijperi TaxID=599730 RepID=A0A9P8Q3G5_WICPI|nr:hypothetical protein WICPIJ_005653 [Wickerhamomyces pijperi]